MSLDVNFRYSRTRRIFHLTLALLPLLVTGGTAQALETDWRGYLGYAGVALDEDIDCESRACQGALASSLFYGLSLSLQGEELGAQFVVSQDDEEEPEFSIAQLTARTGLGGIQIGARLGKIIVPLGLHGSQRITPTARPGLMHPQSFLLNTFYDFLTLSDQGIAIQANSESWAFKIAAFEPREEIVESVISSPPGLINQQVNLLDALLSLLFGSNTQTPGSGNTVTLREKREFEGGYVGLGHQGEKTRTDLGFVRLDLNDTRIEAFNLGNSWLLGAWEPSIELIHLKFDETGNRLKGVSLNLTYSAEKWQAFGNIVDIEVEDDSSREFVTGAAYYWDQNWSSLLTVRRLESNFSAINDVDSDEVNSVGLSLAYSWQ